MNKKQIAEAIRDIIEMPLSELRSRENALPELKGRLSNLALEIQHLGDNGEITSPEVGAFAAAILNTEPSDIGPASKPGTKLSLETFVTWSKAVAGSALSQMPDAGAEAQTSLPLSSATKGVNERAISDAIQHRQALPVMPQENKPDA